VPLSLLEDVLAIVLEAQEVDVGLTHSGVHHRNDLPGSKPTLDFILFFLIFDVLFSHEQP